MLGPYYGSLAFGDLKKKLRVTKRYKEKFTEVTVGFLRTCVLELSRAGTGNEVHGQSL